MSDPIPLHQHRLTSREHGQSIIEFALVMPFLVLILLGIIDLSRAYQTYVVVTNASREGARWGATHPTDNTGIQTRATAEAADSGVTVNVSNPVCFQYGTPTSITCDSAQNGDELSVTVKATFQFATLYIFRLPSLKISNSATMAIINNQVPQ